jgi:DNA-binding SARP family transcriptional activator
MELRLLTALAVCRPAAVSLDKLTDAMWPAGPPTSARKTVQTNVFRLRAKLGLHAIETVGDRYRLAQNVETDIERFERAVEAAREKPASASEWDRALGWCGDAPLEELQDWPPADGPRSRLIELRSSAIEARWEAALEEADPATVIPALEALVSADPLRERRWSTLLRAYQRAGRRAEGLRAFERARRTLSVDLGVSPGVELVEAYEGLLRDDTRSNSNIVTDSSVVSHVAASDAQLDEANAAIRRGDTPRAIQLYLSAAQHARDAGDARRFAEAALGAAGDGWRTSLDATQPVVSLLIEALQRVPAGPTPMRSRLLARFAIARSHHLPVAETAPSAYKSLAIARVVEQPAVLAEALLALSIVVWDPLERDNHWAWVNELAALSEVHPAEPWGRWALPIDARLRVSDGDVAGAGKALDRLASESSDAGDSYGKYAASYGPVLRATVAGDWDAARDAASGVRAASEGALFDPTATGLQQMGMLGIIDLLAGPAEVPVLPLIEWPLPTMELAVAAWHADGLARFGRTDEANAALSAIDPSAVLAVERDSYWLATLSMLADAAHISGCRPIADVVAECLEPVVSMTIADPGLCYRGSAAHAAGLVAATCGRHSKALDLLTAGLVTHSAQGSPWMCERSRGAINRLVTE